MPRVCFLVVNNDALKRAKINGNGVTIWYIMREQDNDAERDIMTTRACLWLHPATRDILDTIEAIPAPLEPSYYSPPRFYRIKPTIDWEHRYRWEIGDGLLIDAENHIRERVRFYEQNNKKLRGYDAADAMFWDVVRGS